MLTGELAGAFNLPQSAGFLVQRVAEGSPAAHAQVKGGTIRAAIQERPVLLGGDVMLAVQGIPIQGQQSYPAIRDALTRVRPGEPIRLTVLRAGARLELQTLRPN